MAKRMVQSLAPILNAIEDRPSKLQVAAYARVSTDKEEQEDSFERQVEHYKQMILARSDWAYVGIYADPGLSGTRAEKRPDFLRMIADCRAGRIGKILVKSISRFARNTVDALQYIRELKELGIGVYFESENIDTLTPGGEVLLTILAAIAEQESRTISSNIKWAYRKRFESGNVLINTGLLLGYRKTGKDKDGFDEYEIAEEEAEIVRRIYREYLGGMTVTRICRNLEADGIPTKLGHTHWYARTVMNILSNEIYTGNATMGKTYKPDVLSKKRYKNNGQAPIFHVRGSHPAIIEEGMFEAVKKEMEFRSEGGTSAAGQSKYTSKYPFSGLLICGKCGAKLRRHVRTVGSGKRVPAWGCARKISEGKDVCSAKHVNEETLEKTYNEAMLRIMEDPACVTSAVEEGLAATANARNGEDIDLEIIKIQDLVARSRKDRAEGRLEETEYVKLIKESAEKVKRLEAERDEQLKSKSEYYAAGAWLKSFKDAASSGALAMAENGAILKQMVESIVVYESHMEIALRCGVSIKQEYEK